MRTDMISDKELIRRYLDNYVTALEALIERYRQRVFAYIMMLVRDKQLAEDVFQDTFIKAIPTVKRGGYNEQGKFLPCVMRIAHNLVVDHFRAKSRKIKTS